MNTTPNTTPAGTMCAECDAECETVPAAHEATITADRYQVYRAGDTVNVCDTHLDILTNEGAI